MVHVHVVSIFGGLLDHCIKSAEEAQEDGHSAPHTIAAMVGALTNGCWLTRVAGDP